MIANENYELVRREIEKQKKLGKEIIIQGRDIEFNRKVLENRKVNMLILSHTDKKDKLKERDSGLNQVLCKLARENNITIVIDFNELKVEDKKASAVILGRIIQNIKLIKKFKNKLIIINSQDKTGISAFLRILGADTKIAKEAAQ